MDERVFQRRCELLDLDIGRLIEEEVPQQRRPGIFAVQHFVRDLRDCAVAHDGKRVGEVVLVFPKAAFLFRRILRELLVLPQRLRAPVAVFARQVVGLYGHGKQHAVAIVARDAPDLLLRSRALPAFFFGS